MFKCFAYLIAILVLILAAALRLPHLSDRPFHGDEAVNAFKLKALWEGEGYRYDPHEYHGPTLPYATLPVIAAASDNFADTYESHYRIVTAIFGVALVALTLAAAPGIGWHAAIIAALLTALSTAMVFYSRYYIHETPLVVFTFAAILSGWRFLLRPSHAWAAALGASLALMHATKETAVLAWFAMLIATIAAHLLRSPKATPRGHLGPKLILSALVSFLLVYILLFSSFFTNWHGLLDGVTTFSRYLHRGTGGEVENLHDHPWHFYLERLIFYRHPANGPWFSEALIPLLALVGIGWAFFTREKDCRWLPFARFMAIYTLVLTALYCAIPYKTPWCALGFLHGMTILSGIGAVALWRWAPKATTRTLVLLALFAAVSHLTWQSYRANFVLHTHRSNPWVYAHPLPKVRGIGQRIEQIASTNDAMRVLVVCDENYWPLPFYLRRVKNVAYAMQLPAHADTDLLIVSRRFTDEVPVRFGDLYGPPEGFGIRPDLALMLYVRKDVRGKLP